MASKKVSDSQILDIRAGYAQSLGFVTKESDYKEGHLSQEQEHQIEEAMCEGGFGALLVKQNALAPTTSNIPNIGNSAKVVKGKKSTFNTDSQIEAFLKHQKKQGDEIAELGVQAFNYGFSTTFADRMSETLLQGLEVSSFAGMTEEQLTDFLSA